MSLNQQQSLQKKQPKEVLVNFVKAIEAALSDPEKWPSVERMACESLKTACQMKMEERDRNRQKEEGKYWTQCLQRSAQMIDKIRHILSVIQRTNIQWTTNERMDSDKCCRIILNTIGVDYSANERIDPAKFYEIILGTIEEEYPTAKTSLTSCFAKLRTCVSPLSSSEGCNTMENMHQEDPLHKLDGANAPETYTLELINLFIWALDVSVKEANELIRPIRSVIEQIMQIASQDDKKEACVNYLRPLHAKVAKIASQAGGLIKLIDKSPNLQKKTLLEQPAEIKVCEEVKRVAWEITVTLASFQTTVEGSHAEILQQEGINEEHIDTIARQIEVPIQKVYQQAKEHFPKMHVQIKEITKTNTDTTIRPKRSSAPS
jgi:hypothetical protein